MVLKVGSVKAGILKFGSTRTDWGLLSITRQAKAVGQVKSGQLLSPRIVEFPPDATELNDVPILVPRLGAGHRAYPSGIRGISVTWLLGQRHRAPPLILTATSSTNGAQTRNVVVPSLCSVAPSGSAALANDVEREKPKPRPAGTSKAGRRLPLPEVIERVT